MNSKYKISKYKNSKLDDTEDHISIEEPLEINLKYKDGKDWKQENLSITMRTPGDDAVSYTHLTLPTILLV